MSTTMPIELYTDGSSLGNPGAAGYGFIIRYWAEVEGSDVPEIKQIEGKQGYRLSTNNRMEIMGGIFGLRAILDRINDGTMSGANQINLFSDSEYFCNAINQNWIQKWSNNNWMTSGFQGRQPAPVMSQDLWKQVMELQNTIRGMGINLTVTHVKGHSGNEFNEQADKLAVAASNDGNNHLIDSWYEEYTANRRKR